MPLTFNFLLLLNLIIILINIYFGMRAMFIFGFLALLATFFYSLRIREFIIYSFLSLTATMCIFYLYSVKIKRLQHKINAELDSTEEEKNILTVEVARANLENTSLKEKLHRYVTLKGLTEALSSTLSFADAVNLVTKEAFRIIGKSRVSLLYLIDREKQKLNLVSTKMDNNQARLSLEKEDIFDHWMLKTRTPLVVEDTKNDFRFNLQDTDIEEDLRRVRSLIATPLMNQKKLLGILRLDDTAPRSYNADDLRLLDIISDLAAVTVENTLLYRQTQELAITDGLTGLFVHRYFHERFDQELSRTLQTNSQLAILLLDIDDFKRYNDNYGHIAGDIVLKKIAKLLNSCCSPGNIVARYGGEEFAVLFVNTPQAEALKIAEAIREKVEKEQFVLRRVRTEVRISGGIASFPEDGQVKEKLFTKADQALYRAKFEGKNRICTP